MTEMCPNFFIHRKDIHYKQIKINDSYQEDIGQYFEDAVRFIGKNLRLYNEKHPNAILSIKTLSLYKSYHRQAGNIIPQGCWSAVYDTTNMVGKKDQ